MGSKKSSAQLPIDSADWHIAHCREGACSRSSTQGATLTKILAACCRRESGSRHQQGEMDEAVSAHILAGTCERTTRRL